MRRKLRKLFNEKISPSLSSHSGGILLEDYVNNRVFVRFTGGCQGCSSANLTLKDGVEKLVKQVFPHIIEVIDVTNHAAGENPYYREDGGSSVL